MGHRTATGGFPTSREWGTGYDATSVLQTGIRACVAGGKLVVVGLGGETATLPIASAACKEIDIVGSFRYCNTVGPSCFTMAPSFCQA